MEGSKPGQTRRRLDEQMWRAVLARFDGAAMTVQEFCLREGLTRSSFTRWRARLRTGSKRLPAPAVFKAAAPALAPAPKPSFVDLGLVGAAAPAAEYAAVDLRIELGGGLSLHLVRR
jgi:transposase-like protein